MLSVVEPVDVLGTQIIEEDASEMVSQVSDSFENLRNFHQIQINISERY